MTSSSPPDLARLPAARILTDRWRSLWGSINNAIGSNTNLMAVTQSGTPTFHYPGGQNANGSPTILANPAVPYVNCFAYSNGQGNWTMICFNNNPNMPEFVTLAGPGAPTGKVTKTIFPKAAKIVDHNEDSFLDAATKAPAVVAPAPSSASGSTYVIPPASFIALRYTTAAHRP